MTFIPNPAAIDGLLREGNGLIGTEWASVLRRKSEAIIARAKTNAAVVIPQSAAYDIVGYDLENGIDGLQSVIRARKGGTISNYLDEKAIREVGSGQPGDWLASALEAAKT